MAQSLLELYEQQCRPVIEADLKALEGRPLEVVIEEAQFRQHVIGPTWEHLPLPVRLLGREPLRCTQARHPPSSIHHP